MSQTPNSNGHKPRILGFSLVFLLIVLIGGAVYYNNRRRTTIVSGEVHPATDSSNEAAGDAEAAETVSEKPPEKEEAPVVAVPETPASSVRFSHAVGPVACVTRDSARYGLQVGFRLTYSDSSLVREIQQRQENIERLVRFVFARKVPAQINADSARVEILSRINGFLSTGKVEDLVFTAFDIIPMENP